MTTPTFDLPQGFRAAGIHCGIKADPEALDLALFVSDRPATSAGVFTQNRVCGAPVKVSRERIKRTTSRAVILNSGNSNACTGAKGLEDARWLTAETAKLLNCDAEDVFVCSTGVIGRFLPLDKFKKGIPAVVDKLAASPEAWFDAARAIMTTDTFAKQSVRAATINGQEVRVAGVAKGAAMISPNMATMLSVVMTDAEISVERADRMLRHAVDRSFNCISVEGHTSTSDTVLLLANGAAATGPVDGENAIAIQQMLDEVCADLATAIIRDAEGADHLITIDVRGLRTRDEAFRIAKAVADSPLVKTAITGADPNWGRIVSAVGYAGVDLREEDISLRMNGTLIYQAGAPVAYDESQLVRQIKERRDVSIELDLTLGDAAVRYWTSDLTCEYVRLNSDYTT